eukprot:TRINITY_DN3717_c0_g1_i1.p1 TRINITY_DN3717_c0_g1~~TRINITY_DN3717_c0_g1_i1.p1  ORF type:complete len:473 (+),score=126.92 TRINITY_DN3717_c0_g1_i1:57-1475(+)
MFEDTEPLLPRRPKVEEKDDSRQEPEKPTESKLGWAKFGLPLSLGLVGGIVGGPGAAYVSGLLGAQVGLLSVMAHGLLMKMGLTAMGTGVGILGGMKIASHRQHDWDNVVKCFQLEPEHYVDNFDTNQIRKYLKDSSPHPLSELKQELINEFLARHRFHPRQRTIEDAHDVIVILFGFVLKTFNRSNESKVKESKSEGEEEDDEEGSESETKSANQSIKEQTEKPISIECQLECYEFVQREFFTSDVFDTIMTFLREQMKELDEKFEIQAAKLRAQVIDKMRTNTPITIIQELLTTRTPRSKLDIIRRALNVIESIDPADLGAEKLFPAAVCAFAASEVPYLHAELAFIEEFLPDCAQVTSGIEGYTMTTFKAVLGLQTDDDAVLDTVVQESPLIHNAKFNPKLASTFSPSRDPLCDMEIEDVMEPTSPNSAPSSQSIEEDDEKELTMDEKEYMYEEQEENKVEEDNYLKQD